MMIRVKSINYLIARRNVTMYLQNLTQESLRLWPLTVALCVAIAIVESIFVKNG